MAQEVDEVLQHIQELTRAARHPGQLSRTQLQAEMQKVSAAIQESMTRLSAQLQPQAASPQAVAAETLKARLQSFKQRNRLAPQRPEERKKLGDQMKSLKWGFIRT